MEVTYANLVSAGAIRHLCAYFDSIGGKDEQWSDVEQYAKREWRDAPTEDIANLIERCKQCWEHARLLNIESEAN